MSRWQRWTGWALSRPVLALVAGLALRFAAPALGMRLGMPGARVVDEGRSSRDGYEIIVNDRRGVVAEAAITYVAARNGRAEQVPSQLRVDGSAPLT